MWNTSFISKNLCLFYGFRGNVSSFSERLIMMKSNVGSLCNLVLPILRYLKRELNI
jgi:hypothetical protein